MIKISKDGEPVVFELDSNDNMRFGYCKTHKAYMFEFDVAGKGKIRTHLSFADVLDLTTTILTKANERVQDDAATVKAEAEADAALQAEIAAAQDQAEYEPKRFRAAEGA